LCLALGVRHPNDLQLTEWELLEWMAYFQQAPFGDDVNHLMAARIISAWSGKSERTHMPRVNDNVDPDLVYAENYLQELVRYGDC
jgi:hypothetical protein